MILYAVVTIVPNDISRDRCVAICTTLDRAKEIVENNVWDIWETVYDWVVIEEKRADEMYAGFNNEQFWYEWKGPRGDEGIAFKGYVPCERPEKYDHIVGFGIG
jgi:hypothetical protein